MHRREFLQAGVVASAVGASVARAPASALAADGSTNQNKAVLPTRMLAKTAL
jgi:hypothetical protein